jgi:hypothetical protein
VVEVGDKAEGREYDVAMDWINIGGLRRGDHLVPLSTTRRSPLFNV